MGDDRLRLAAGRRPAGARSASRTISLMRSSPRDRRRRWDDVSGRAPASEELTRSVEATASRAPRGPPRAACAACAPTSRREAPPNASPPGRRPRRRRGRSRTRFLARKDEVRCAVCGREGPDHGARPRPISAKRSSCSAESRARGRVGATAHVRPPASSRRGARRRRCRMRRPRRPPRRPRATLQPRAAERTRSAERPRPRASRRWRRRAAASVEPPLTVTEAGLPSSPRRREGYRGSSGVR